MCSHTEYSVIPPKFMPIQCGAALNAPVESALPDNTGDNISEKNREYCELTAHYHAWKNTDADFYGFCHYRRFFCFDNKIKKPYLVFGELKENKKHLFGNEQKIERLCEEFDMIVPIAEDMGIPAEEHYSTSKFHYAEDLKLFMTIIAERAPQILDSAHEYLAQNKQYFCNMFIMDKPHFFEYCEMMFPILEEFDKRKVLHGSFQSDRTDGFLGELFTGMYITYAKANGAAVKELPRIDINCKISKRIFYRLLPPESKRRFTVKRIVKSLIR